MGELFDANEIPTLGQAVIDRAVDWIADALDSEAKTKFSTADIARVAFDRLDVKARDKKDERWMLDAIESDAVPTILQLLAARGYVVSVSARARH